MPWPTPVVRQFEKVPVNPDDLDFCGPYNRFLYTLFPPDTLFTVVPQYITASRESNDFVVSFEVTLEDKPVLILVLKRPSDIRNPYRRETADVDIRNRMRDQIGDCPIPVLHAVSAMGTKLCFFTKHRGQAVQPPVISPDPVDEIDTAPLARWGYDVLEGDGEQRFREMVDEIKQACAAL